MLPDKSNSQENGRVISPDKSKYNKKRREIINKKIKTQ
jgi:hypothetical protein